MKVLKFGAVWCSGCLVMRPLWQEIEAENPWLETEYHDFDEDKEAVEKYQINEILPVAIFLDKEGNEIVRINGEKDKKSLVEIINQNKDK